MAMTVVKNLAYLYAAKTVAKAMAPQAAPGVGDGSATEARRLLLNTICIIYSYHSSPTPEVSTSHRVRKSKTKGVSLIRTRYFAFPHILFTL
jgi:hypothetical protein